MPLLALPNELLESILSLLDWEDILSFICTTKHITNHVLSKSSYGLLRKACRSHLLAWELEEREKRDWPLEEDPGKGSWIARHGPPHLCKPLRDITHLPCYVCLNKRPASMFSSGMSSGGHAIGQERGYQRKCIRCGVKTGFYARGCRLPYSRAVCIRCGHLMCARTGWWRDLEDFSLIKPNLGRREIDTELLFGDSRTMSLTRFWWWKYSRMCFECVLAENWTAEDFFAKAVRGREKEMWSQKAHHRYAKSMLDARQRRVERGRLKREELGVCQAETAATRLVRPRNNTFSKYRLNHEDEPEQLHHRGQTERSSDRCAYLYPGRR